MKSTKHILTGLTIATFGLAFGCNTDGVNSPTLDDTVAESLSLTSATATLNEEMTDAQAAGIDIEDVNALFSLAWHPFVDRTTQEEEIKGKAFAVAPNADSTMQPRLRSGLDMGQVFINYPDGSLELNKMEKRNGGFFYGLGKKGRGRFGDEGSADEAVNIPFIAGATYTFEATGSETFAAVSVGITAPGSAIEVTSHEQDAEIDGSVALDLTWSGGVADQPVVVSLSPARERPDGQGAGRGPGSGSGRGGRSGGRGSGRGHGRGMGPGGPGRFHGARFELETNTGAFTVPAEELQNLLSNENISGIKVQITQIQKSDIELGEAKYALHLRTSDAVKLQVAN